MNKSRDSPKASEAERLSKEKEHIDQGHSTQDSKQGQTPALSPHSIYKIAQVAESLAYWYIEKCVKFVDFDDDTFGYYFGRACFLFAIQTNLERRLPDSDLNPEATLYSGLARAGGILADDYRQLAQLYGDDIDDQIT